MDKDIKQNWTLTAADAESLGELVQNLETAGGLLVRDGRGAALFDEGEVLVTLGGEEHHKVAGRVVNLTPEGGCYIQLEAGSQVDALTQAAKTAIPSAGTDTSEEEETPDSLQTPEPGVDEADEEAGPTRVRPTPAWDLIDPTSDEPLHKQIRKLSVADKLRVARQATRPVREILIRDVEKRIHMEIIHNPKISDEEIEKYSGIRGLSPKALVWISQQTKFLRRRKVLLNIITNPMTPIDTATKLLTKLNQNELLRISRSGQVREKISRAARKKLMAAGIL